MLDSNLTRSQRLLAARVPRMAAAAALLALLPACAVVGTSVGPSRGSVTNAAETQTIPGLHVVEVSSAVARGLAAVPSAQANGFAEALSGAEPAGSRVGIGDTIEVTIWEASPPALFGTANLGASGGVNSSVTVSQPNALPGFLVGETGTISVPFAGVIRAAGRTPRQIEQEITRRLQGRAHLPQVVVRITGNATATVSVLGDVTNPSQVPLTPAGERLLDVLSRAGGTREPLDRMTIQVTRGDIVRTITAREILANPRNNVVLQSGDVVTALYQPASFTVLGATGKNDEVRFEGVGLSLAQALGRVGGLQNERADPKGVFVFRWEKPREVGQLTAPVMEGAPGVPVIYRADMKDPATYLAAQKFAMRDGDVLYVSTSPAADFQRFVNLLASSILPISTVRAVVP